MIQLNCQPSWVRATKSVKLLVLAETSQGGSQFNSNAVDKQNTFIISLFHKKSLKDVQRVSENRISSVLRHLDHVQFSDTFMAPSVQNQNLLAFNITKKDCNLKIGLLYFSRLHNATFKFGFQTFVSRNFPKIAFGFTVFEFQHKIFIL